MASPINVVGLNSDNYLINNEIIISLTSADNPTSYTVKLENLTNGITTSNFIIYVSPNGDAKMNLSKIIKSIFTYPETIPDGFSVATTVPNINQIRITITENKFNTSLILTKYFIRGGNRTNDTNQTLPNASWLTPSAKLPAWSGYPIAGWKLENGSINKKLYADLPETLVDIRREKGCNSLYVKFLNQRGGYSYWLFDNYALTEGNANQGAYIRNNKVDDLGNESESKIQATGKVPKEYIDLIKDLIVSPEIYLLQKGVFIRVLSERNTIIKDDNKRNYTVKINFGLEFRFNPSMLW